MSKIKNSTKPTKGILKTNKQITPIKSFKNVGVVATDRITAENTNRNTGPEHREDILAKQKISTTDSINTDKTTKIRFEDEYKASSKEKVISTSQPSKIPVPIKQTLTLKPAHTDSTQTNKIIKEKAVSNISSKIPVPISRLKHNEISKQSHIDTISTKDLNKLTISNSNSLDNKFNDNNKDNGLKAQDLFHVLQNISINIDSTSLDGTLEISKGPLSWLHDYTKDDEFTRLEKLFEQEEQDALLKDETVPIIPLEILSSEEALSLTNSNLSYHSSLDSQISDEELTNLMIINSPEVEENSGYINTNNATNSSSNSAQDNQNYKEQIKKLFDSILNLINEMDDNAPTDQGIEASNGVVVSEVQYIINEIIGNDNIHNTTEPYTNQLAHLQDRVMSMVDNLQSNNNISKVNQIIERLKFFNDDHISEVSSFLTDAPSIDDTTLIDSTQGNHDYREQLIQINTLVANIKTHATTKDLSIVEQMFGDLHDIIEVFGSEVADNNLPNDASLEHLLNTLFNIISGFAINNDTNTLQDIIELLQIIDNGANESIEASLLNIDTHNSIDTNEDFANALEEILGNSTSSTDTFFEDINTLSSTNTPQDFANALEDLLADTTSTKNILLEENNTLDLSEYSSTNTPNDLLHKPLGVIYEENPEEIALEQLEHLVYEINKILNNSNADIANNSDMLNNVLHLVTELNQLLDNSDVIKQLNKEHLKALETIDNVLEQVPPLKESSVIASIDNTLEENSESDNYFFTASNDNFFNADNSLVNKSFDIHDENWLSTDANFFYNLNAMLVSSSFDNMFYSNSLKETQSFIVGDHSNDIPTY